MVRGGFLALLLCWLAFVSFEATATPPPTISFYVTVRDFMAQACRIYPATGPTGAPTPTATSQRNTWCPDDPTIQTAVAAGTLSGHPDFQRTASIPVYTSNNAPVAPYPGGFPVTCSTGDCNTSPRTLPFVTQTLLEDSAGIPLMQYCSTGNCDYLNSSRSVMDETSFSTWHKDDSKYNKRVGYKQPLTLKLDNTGTYSFSSTVDANLDNFFTPITRFNLGGWPLSQDENSRINQDPKAGGFSKNFWFTTEIHTSFEYKGTEKFTFSGDDDVHIFVNGRLALNLGGLHSENGGSITLSQHAAPSRLNLEIGKIYQFDMFHAERQTSESNFKLETTLGETCNVITSDLRSNGRNVENGIDWKKTGGRSNDSDWVFISGPGYGSINNLTKEALLMKSGIPNVASYMFFRQQQNSGSGFSFAFKFKASGNGHGFAVLFHDRELGLHDFNGGTGPNLGIKNTDNSFAILFDMCPNFPDCTTPTGAAAKSSIRLHYNLNGTRLNSALNNAASATRRKFDNNVQQLWNDGLEHVVEIFYYEKPDWLEVYVDNSLRLRQKGFSVEDVIGGRDASVGFSSASSDQGQSMDVNIYDVTMKSVKVVATKTIPAASENVAEHPKSFIANGRDSVSFALQTKDACNNTIEFGGSAQLAQGRLVATKVSDLPPSSGRRLQDGESLILIPEIVDLNNGQYAAKFKTDVLADFDAYLAFGNCTWNGTLFISNNTDCFTQIYYGAAVSIPFNTLAPTSEEETAGLGTAALAGIGVAAGVVGVCGTIMVIIGVGIRNRWRRDKRFIDEGKKLVAERGVAYVGDNELDALQNKLQATMHALNAERAKKLKDEDKQGAIDALLRQKGELQEVVRRLKIAQAGGDPNAPEERMTMGGRVRKSFAASRVSRGPSMRYSRGASVFNQNPNTGEASSSNPIFARLRQSVSRPSRPTSKSQALVHQEEPSGF